MELKNSIDPLLQLVNRPAFCVKDGCIIYVNELATQYTLEVGDPISKFLHQGLEEYNAFTEGCLFVTIHVVDIPYSTTVTKLDDCDLFLLEKLADNARQALALASQQLRLPLNSLFALVDEMKTYSLISRVSHSLNHMHHLICNMADLTRYDTREALYLQPTELSAAFDQAMEKATAALKNIKIKVKYTPLSELIVSMADQDMLERAILNLVANAAKFSNRGDTLYAALIRKGDMLQFTLQDNGEGIPSEIMQTAFFRYLREPCIEDCRHGLGLGLALVCSVASCHGGTVLITQPKKGGTKVTMTFPIVPCSEDILRSPVRIPTSDYASGFDRALLELADILPVSAFKKKSS